MSIWTFVLGIVAGIECTVGQEERYRRHFEDTMKEIYPPIFSDDYYIHFAPVLGDNGRQQGELNPNLYQGWKTMSIQIRGSGWGDGVGGVGGGGLVFTIY